jgi:hypothetical protein
VENIHLYNLTGTELVVSYTLLADGLQINVSGFPQGLYLLEVNNQIVKIQKR